MGKSSFVIGHYLEVNLSLLALAHSILKTSAQMSMLLTVGHTAGGSITTGTLNTFVGGEAGDAFTDAQHNTAIGYQALTSDTQGDGIRCSWINALNSLKME